MTQAQPLIQTLPMTLGAPMSDDPSDPTAIEIPLQIELPNGQTLFAAVALGGLPFDGQRQIAERITAAWNAFTGVTTEEIKAPVKCLHQIAEPAVVHPDYVAVDALAALMKAKLAKQRGKGYGGWDTDCTQQHLSNLLRGHVDKGDPVDVANFCAFLLALGEGIAAAPQAVQPAVPQLKANCYSDDDGDYWRDCPDDCDFVEGLEVGDTYELQASIRAWSETFRVTKAPDETSDDYEVELVSSNAPAHPAEGVPAQAVGEMTAERASYFMRRFLKEEKLLGPNEQAALHYVISLLAATQPAADAVASIYVTAGGEREFDDWKVPLSVGRNLLYTQPAAQELDAPESEYRRGYRHGYNSRDAEVKGALA